jgi:hypothetical protein
MTNNGWIRFETETPPTGETVLYCDDEGVYGVATLEPDGDFYEQGIGSVPDPVWWQRIAPPPDLPGEHDGAQAGL